MIGMRFHSDLFHGIGDSIRFLGIDYTPIIMCITPLSFITLLSGFSWQQCHSDCYTQVSDAVLQPQRLCKYMKHRELNLNDKGKHMTKFVTILSCERSDD